MAGIFRTGVLAPGRVEAFSDGVLAFVITLLVLDIKLPEELGTDPELWAGVRGIMPQFAAWVVSFVFVLTFWVNHHFFFASLRHADRGMLWLNGLFLLGVTTIPFPTGLVGRHPGLTAPLALLSGSMLMTSLAFLLMRLYATYHASLLRDHISAPEARHAAFQSLLSPSLYGLALALSFVWPPGAIGIQILVPVIFFLRSPISKTKE